VPVAASAEAWVGTPADASVPDVVAASAAGRPVLLAPAVVTTGIAGWFTQRHPGRTWVLGGTAQAPTGLFAALTVAATPPVPAKLETR
jgi:hypothetical protein